MMTPTLVSLFLLTGPSLAQIAGGFNAFALCQQQAILANGIVLNIEDQQQELATINQIGQILKQTPVNMQQFAAAKTTLLTFVNNGIAIRQLNQRIAPKGNNATAGLAKVAMAQLTELSLASSLTGDPAKDLAIVAQLQKDFTGGIGVNQQNRLAALAGCAQVGGGVGVAPPAAPPPEAAAPPPAAAPPANGTNPAKITSTSSMVTMPNTDKPKSTSQK